MAPDERSAPNGTVLQDCSATAPLFVDTESYDDIKDVKREDIKYYDPLQSDYSRDCPLSTAIGDSLRSIAALYDVSPIVRMPELSPYETAASERFEYSPQIPHLSPMLMIPNNCGLMQTSPHVPPQPQKVVLPKKRGLSKAALAMEFDSEEKSEDHRKVPWLQKSRDQPRVAGELKRKIMQHVHIPSDLNIPKAIALEKIKKRIFEKTGDLVPKWQIERLLYGLKRKRREQFKRENEHFFEGMDWDFSDVVKSNPPVPSDE